MKCLFLILLTSFLCSANVYSAEASSTGVFLKNNIWSENFEVPLGGRPNPFSQSDSDFVIYKNRGKLHTQKYPLEITGMLPPYEPVKNFFDADFDNPFRLFLQTFVKGLVQIESFNEVLNWIGLQPYPLETDTGVYSVPYPEGKRPEYGLGFGVIEKTFEDQSTANGFSISCAACHAGRLFGKTVLGLTNRFPHANEVFIRAKQVLPLASKSVFKLTSGASKNEANMLKDLKTNMKSVGVNKPLVLGLDSSLAQVSLSLALREEDSVATKSSYLQKNPHPDYFDSNSADSKPAVWWNLKYKNRWLSDGSIISGNPIFTNILWNELGRGVDLPQLDLWLQKNDKTIQELTTAVFSMEAPSYSDFFDVSHFALEDLKHGEQVFNKTCSGCHGKYEKAWNDPLSVEALQSGKIQFKDLLKTTLVKYHKKTPVIDVGTDPMRFLGMKALEKLNNLQISKNNGTVVKVQKGYVPPPLVGIWARWPYFHNNSAPSLCAVLSKATSRPVTFQPVEANDPLTDFDQECNGYPIAANAPKNKQTFFDTRKQGLTNTGHDEGIFLDNGQEILSQYDKNSLILFLKTL